MIDKNTLPQDVQEILNKILAEEPSDLNKEALDFLRARQDYLTNAEKELYFKKAEEVTTNQPVVPVRQKRHRRNKNK